VDVARAVACTVEFMAFRHATRTPLKPRKESKSLLSLICALRIMLWSVLWHLSIMEFACGLRLVMIFCLTPHSFLRVLLTSRANSFPLSTVISAGHRCRVSQWSSNQLAIMSAVCSPISTVSKNHVAGSVTVTQWSSMCVSGFLGSSNLHGPTRSAHGLCQGMISGLGLGGSRPFFWSRFLLAAQFHSVCMHAHMWTWVQSMCGVVPWWVQVLVHQDASTLSDTIRHACVVNT